ncbi:MAG TPA: GGDEF domain-containing protein [Methyloceanibacter sp.]|nr:GGDEF domain-containing protein [Methyloceanibacter sp.]
MNPFTPKMLGRAITAHPRASLQDALLLLVLMLAALLLALQYDLFFFIDRLSQAQLQISLAEAIFLTLLLTASLFVFVLRRLNDQRCDSALRAAAEIELRELTALVTEDPLTGLLNRRALMEALAAATKSPPENGTQHALFMMDLNGFKRVNDHHGHSVGDQVLEIVADRFRAAGRPSDLVARIGGDEFAVLAYNVDRKDAHKIGMRFVDNLTQSIRAGGHTHQISVAAGVAFVPDDGVTAEKALRKADIAMYRAKALGEALLFFAPDMDGQQRIA